MKIEFQAQQTNIESICRSFNLGKPLSALSKITGGLIHKMWKLETETGIFAIKELNPEIMKRPNLIMEMNRSEMIANKYKSAGVEAVCAIEINGSYVFENLGNAFYGDADFKRAVYDGVYRKDVSIASLSELIALYKIIPRQSIFNLINSKIEARVISLSELIKLNSFYEFNKSLEPIIEKSYNINFSNKPALFKPRINNNTKLLYITAHFLCDRLFSLNRTGEIGTIITLGVRYSIDIEFIGGSSIVRGASNFTYSFYKLSNRLVKQRLGFSEDDEGEFNFDNLLQSVINELELRASASVGIKSFSLVKTTRNGKQNLFKFNFN
jgi:hypothetical protein